LDIYHPNYINYKLYYYYKIFLKKSLYVGNLFNRFCIYNILGSVLNCQLNWHENVKFFYNHYLIIIQKMYNKITILKKKKKTIIVQKMYDKITILNKKKKIIIVQENV
jgi:hypothetical protein